MTTQVIYQGNNLDLLARLPDCSVDAVVTDPPYGLSFMGRDWDKALPDPRTWEECLRVLKPGGHLVAFGAPRLYHRLACQIEDAGFEMRDCLLWLFAQGFPKSLDVAWEMHKSAGSWYGPMVESDHGQTLPEHRVRFVRASYLQAPVYACAQCGQVLQPRVPEQGAQEYRAAWFKSETRWPEQPGMEGRGHVEAPEGELSRCEVCSMHHGFLADGAGGRVHHGAQTGDGSPPWAVIEPDGSCPSYRPQSVEQLHRQPDAVSVERRAQTFRGFQTALKPAYEPIALARKPLAGTAAANVLAHGTGAINVDGCRVETDDNLNGGAYSKERQPSDSEWATSGSIHKSTGAEYAQPAGRWPANLILDEDAGAMLGEAARFFYCPKASRAEREAGLDHLPERVVDESRGQDTPGRESPRAGAGRSGSGRKNPHPTVKPIALMQWLVRLVCPPGGIVLEPFAGSGSTLVACALEDRDAIGMELDPEYVTIGRARVAHARGTS